jgi:hypothetical protein
MGARGDSTQDLTVLEDRHDRSNGQTGRSSYQPVLDSSCAGVILDEASYRAHASSIAIVYPVAGLCGSGPAPFSDRAGDAHKMAIKTE